MANCIECDCSVTKHSRVSVKHTNFYIGCVLKKQTLEYVVTVV